MSGQSSNTFWREFFLDGQALLFLVVVCSAIAVFANYLNGLGLLPNLYISLGFGVPISIIETWLRTRRQPLPPSAINFLAWGLGCLVGSANIYAYLAQQGILYWGYFSFELLYNLGFGFIVSGIVFYFFWAYYRAQSLALALKEQAFKVSQAEAARTEAEYRLLQSQMKPHFLFNTLATIQTLIDLDPVKARKMVADLSLLLRGAIQNSQANLCTLEAELEWVQAYLNIQRIRAGNRIQYKESVDRNCLMHTTLPMSLQPLFENAIIHGLDCCTGIMQLELEVRCENATLVMVVSNSLSENTTERKHHSGVSLQNIEKRLNLTFGDRAQLKSHAIENGWRTEIQHPIQQESTP